MIGAMAGDIAGSRFEFFNHRSKDFKMFADDCFPTDDSIMTAAVAKAILESKEDYSDLKENTIKYMREIGRNYPDCGYGGTFYWWIMDDEKPEPYNSFGNGAAMRVSPAGFVGKTLEEVKLISKTVTGVSHNHPEGLKGAEATAVAIFLARNGKTKEEIKEYICENYYDIDFTLDEIRDTYEFNETCQETVPQALEAFFESTDFEDAIRNAISIGGDSDTLGAICGGIAEAYYGVSDYIKDSVCSYLEDDIYDIVEDFYDRYM